MSKNNKKTENILSILNNSLTYNSKEQNDIYKNNLANDISKYPDNKNSIDLLDNYVSQKGEATQEIIGFLYNGLNSNKPEIQEKYISFMEKIDTKNINEKIQSDISNSLINILKNGKNQEVKNPIFNIFKKNFELNENQTNQIETQKLCNKLDKALL